MDEAFANYYLALLANKIATNDGLDLMTDVYAYDQYTKKFMSTDRISPKQNKNKQLLKKTAEGLLLQLSTKKIIIRNDVPLTKILEFRNKNDKYLSSFRSFIHDEINSLFNSNSFETFQAATNSIISAFDYKIHPEITAIHRKLNESFITYIIKDLHITGPLTIVSFLAQPNTYTKILTLCASAGFSYWHFKYDRNKIKSNKAYYAAAMQNELGLFSNSKNL